MMFQSSLFKRLLCAVLSFVCMATFCLNSAIAASAEAPGPNNISKTPRNSASPIYAANSGNTIAEVVMNLHDREYETIVAFSADGEKICDHTSYLIDSASAPETSATKIINNKGSIIIHNHPDDAAFSGRDLLTAISCHTSYMIVTSPSYVFVLSPSKRGWGDATKVYDYYEKNLAQRLSEIKRVVNGYHPRTYAEIVADPERPDDGTATWYYESEVRRQFKDTPYPIVIIQYSIWASHRANIDLARQFGFFYRRIPIDEFNPAEFGF